MATLSLYRLSYRTTGIAASTKDGVVIKKFDQISPVIIQLHYLHAVAVTDALFKSKISDWNAISENSEIKESERRLGKLDSLVMNAYVPELLDNYKKYISSKNKL